MSHVVVVGGGIAGLAAAWHLRQSSGSEGAAAAEVTVLEGDRRLGGKVLTTEFEGRPVEEGPDAFLARMPAAAELCREVGLGDDLTAPETGSAYIWTRGALHPIPTGTVLGVPAGLGAIRSAGMLSAAGKARAAIEPLLPRRPRQGDVAVGRLVAARFGRDVHERLVDPLIGGINAGRTDALSAEVSAAALAEVARTSRSLMLGLRTQRRAATATATAAAAAAAGERASGATTAPPVFYGVRGGLGRLVDALSDRLRHAGAAVRVGEPVTSIDRAPAGRGWQVGTGTGAVIEADAVVVAAPAFVAAALLSDVSPRAGRMLGGIEYASVDLATVAFPRRAVAVPKGSGFLVPRADGRLMTACTIVSQKWAAIDRPGDVVLRLSAGRFGDERSLGLDDTELVDQLTAELGEAVPVSGPPAASRVSRWVHAFPQFAPGHLDLVAAIEDDLAATAPGVAVAGAAYRGVGIPACVTSGRAAAQRVLQHLDTANLHR